MSFVKCKLVYYIVIYILNIGPLLVLGPRPSPLLHGLRAGPDELVYRVQDTRHRTTLGKDMFAEWQR
jgi:hypothetical protein